MTVTHRESISILQIVVYVPILILGLLLNLRHGFAKSSGWFFLITLSLLRLIGAICWLVYASSPSKGLATAAIICTSIGLSPLTLLCMGLLSRVNDFTTKRIPIQLFRYPSLLSLIGLVLGITGGIIASHATDPFHLNAWSKAAIIIFTLVYIVVLVILVLLIMRVSQVKVGERRLLIVVAVCSPFIATRLIYALISNFADNHLFNSTFGNLTIYLCMAVIGEIMVVIICVAVGFTLAVVPKAATVEEVPIEPTSASGENTNKATHEAPHPAPRQNRRRGGPITWLFRTIRDYFRSKQGQEARAEKCSTTFCDFSRHIS